MSSFIYHQHHIIPKHMGGSDDPSNLKTVTIAEHAEEHRLLYKQHGKEEDRIAWLSLSAQIGKDELIKLKCTLGGKHSKPGSKNGSFTPNLEACSRGGKTQQKNNPNLPSIGGTALWSTPGMREHLVKKRKEQQLTTGNPMKGKVQRRLSCLCCHKEFSINIFGKHLKKVGDSVSTLPPGAMRDQAARA